ncbi:putative transcription factor WD40-like family [Helianthus annuus]|uniref:Putative transducin family protein / WD-40 repeat family protein n=1 Tax=Helianthus annuus TaxID=4232 RepID=A0A251VMZ1_HELAN|nr:U3 small nucleolar RNA-associated protein 21 homolog [Helianthus annuus]KAF5822356.1 putative transcription factor WD40-like family [Helianthus annuus]KAJ0611841.1 putative transcription factor WD40-like family [Helianthus annuus]KAJ0627197.1 putative transcription factor WD40-like family [Helianthus annuus]KAJ0783507.1 putative transcription factor WD40-like family [Helianthus annuus]KAJ0948327.1 putative transcription factor WD40-like family [Helianthus annuus]
MGIFEPFRAIGYITSSVPFSVQRLGTETFVTVSVGKSWQIYNCAKLSLVLAGPQLAKKIRALASYRDYTFAAYGNDIGVFKRAHQVATWSSHNAKVNLLLLFGEHVLSVDVEGNIFIWAFKGIEENLSPVGHILLDSKFTPSCIMHPDTYLNKVILGSQDGSLQLWNINTKTKIYDFLGWNSSIHCCVSSPALDVVAVGCADGKIHVHNILVNEEIVTFSQSTRGAVTSLSFRTDGQPLLASGSSSGVISIWNLEKKRLQSVIRDAHDSSVISLHFFANEPVLMSTSADNSIKMWIFDTTDGDPRLLRFRSGHSAPPLCIKFYANGRHILSAGQDRAFRLFSVVQDQQSRELSQRHVTKRAKKLKVKEEEIKLKPVIAFDVAEIRERDWSNVVTCHMDTPHAYVWRLQNFVLGEHILTPTTDIQAPVKACAISTCGSFAIIGTAAGWIEKFNLQSGLSRGSYVDASEKGNSAHDGAVVGVACDSTNSLMISAGYNGDIKVWSFKGRELKSKWEIGCTVVKIVYNRSNGLLATVTDDLVIRMFDVVALKLVRKFEGHTDRITDICFSEDGKWLMSSSMDGTLRIWDVILARQIDAIHADVPITALSLSPNMDVLATTHVDQNGVYLWVNQAMFSGATNIDSYGSGKEVVNVKLPSVSSGGDSKDDVDSDKPVSTDPQAQAQPVTHTPLLDQQIPDLVTLSLLPKSQWQSLINLDIIKARNKPIEPPKKPENAPFFLPSIPSLSGEIVFKAGEPMDEEKPTHDDKFTRFTDLPSSPFVQFLQSSVETKNFEAFTDYLKSLSSSTLDVELRMLQIIDDDDEQEPEKRPELITLEQLLDYFIHEISHRNNFEFIQALIRLFLKIHGESIRRQSKLQAKAQKLLEAQSAVWQKLDGLFQSARCMVTFLSNSQF